MDSDTSLDSGVLSSDKSVLSFIVDLNKKYELEVSNAAGLINTPHTIFSKIVPCHCAISCLCHTAHATCTCICMCFVKSHVVESSPQSCV